ncbi:GAF domain-containing protein [Streptomyces sp. NPDC059894]|uniref:GAF domain-containing protein n=1 Tax=unclassified Streptomyces TaxID=2593676 RepID=UPI003658FA35
MTLDSEFLRTAPRPDPRRIQATRDLLARHGLDAGPDAVFDEICDRLAEESGFAWAMVDFHLDEQRFAGLHNPPPERGLPQVDRAMDISHGWCPHVVSRRLGLPLHNVHASRLYSGNPVTDAIGINAYFGEPLIYPGTGAVLGTVCIIDQDIRPLADADRYMGMVERATAETMHSILSRPVRTRP